MTAAKTAKPRRAARAVSTAGAAPVAPGRIDWEGIRARLREFVSHYASASYERGQAQAYWSALLRCYDVGEQVLSRAFEHRLKLGKKNNYVDAFIPGKLIVEHKGSHVDLGSAVEQLQGYYSLLPPSEQPRYAVLCNFQTLRLYDFSNLARTVVHECALHELPQKAELFKFLLPDEDSAGFLEQPGVDTTAARAVADLHAALAADGYGGRDLEVLLTRLIFCFFGDDTGIFGENVQFHRLLNATAEDGSDLGPTLAKLFEVLDTAHERRSAKLPQRFADFAYINGQLFAGHCRLPDFDAAQRAVILKCSALNWGSISPAIFGSMFQAVLESGRLDARQKLAAARRELGAHYTSERNILRAIGPLFLDELQAELAAAKTSKPRLQALHDRLAGLRLLDPACGCGNFLVVAFQQLRLLEIELVHRLHGDATKSRGLLDMRDLLRVQVDQFYGIEIDAAAAHIARVALWITDHQMNLVASQRLGQARPSVPLTHSATIVEGNALRIDWATVLPPSQCSYVAGNPPFVGKHYRKPEQQRDLVAVLDGEKGAGDLDYVAAWYIKAARYIQRTSIRCAFVSTNSICQGEQVPVLWPLLFKQGVHIQFAHQAFQWNNEAVGKAAVHCIIIGFALSKPDVYRLFTYSDVRGDEREEILPRINAYLTGGPNVIVTKVTRPVDVRPIMKCGNKPTDDGNFILTPDERMQLLMECPDASMFVRRYIGSDEYLNGVERYCLWLADAMPDQLKKMPAVMRRIDKVRRFREASTAEPTRKAAQTPTKFFFESQPKGRYILIPEVSSEKRIYVPIGFMEPVVISSNKNYLIDEPSFFVAGLLQSAMHMAWMRAVGGRLESRYQYSASMVYNTFPWPEDVEKSRVAIENAERAVLAVRSQFANSTLADLYDPLTMPPELRKAHQKLDKAVDAAYGYKGRADDAERVAFLFERYQALSG